MPTESKSTQIQGFNLEKRRDSQKQTADTLKIKLKVKKGVKKNFTNLPIQVNLKNHAGTSIKNTVYLPNEYQSDLHHVLNPPVQNKFHDSYDNIQSSTQKMNIN